MNKTLGEIDKTDQETHIGDREMQFGDQKILVGDRKTQKAPTVHPGIPGDLFLLKKEQVEINHDRR